jgi:hypothetical protein
MDKTGTLRRKPGAFSISAGWLLLFFLAPVAARAQDPVERLPWGARPAEELVSHENPVIVDLTTSPRRSEAWNLQFLPDGLIYRSYLAGVKESRFSSQWNHDRELGWIWDIALGGRVGISRYGNRDPLRPQGWQLDIEGAVFPRLDLEEDQDLMSTDFRFGIPLTFGRKRYQTKLAYYHLSSHLGDELMLKHPGTPRINFSRDVIVWGHSFYWTENLRLYGEAAWAFCHGGGSKPWEFQFGVEYSPAAPSCPRGAPFFAVNGHLREEFAFGGNLVVQTGWQWRGTSGHLFRLGMHYYVGASDQYEFFDQYEDKIGMAIWYDY